MVSWSFHGLTVDIQASVRVTYGVCQRGTGGTGRDVQRSVGFRGFPPLGIDQRARGRCYADSIVAN